MTEHVIPLSNCPHCGEPRDRSQGATSNAKPAPGDLSICFCCGEISAFTDDLQMRPLNEAEAEFVAESQVVKRAKEQLARVKKVWIKSLS